MPGGRPAKSRRPCHECLDPPLLPRVGRGAHVLAGGNGRQRQHPVSGRPAGGKGAQPGQLTSVGLPHDAHTGRRRRRPWRGGRRQSSPAKRPTRLRGWRGRPAAPQGGGGVGVRRQRRRKREVKGAAAATWRQYEVTGAPRRPGPGPLSPTPFPTGSSSIDRSSPSQTARGFPMEIAHRLPRR